MAAMTKKVFNESWNVSLFVLKTLKPKVQTGLRYARVEMKPPTPREWPEVQRGFNNLITGFKEGRYRNITVKEAWLNTLVATEVMCWFFVGEIIGRRNFVGYVIPP